MAGPYSYNRCVNKRIRALGWGAILVSLASSLLSLYAYIKLNIIFYFFMIFLWIIIALASIKVYLSFPCGNNNS